jgi:molybdopterin synthase catalytic subunit
VAKNFQDLFGRVIRLTTEREAHILRHLEMQSQLDKLEEVMKSPDVIVRSIRDPAVILYHKHYLATPVTEKYLIVVVKLETDDAFVITAFFIDRVKKGERIWEK